MPFSCEKRHCKSKFEILSLIQNPCPEFISGCDAIVDVRVEQYKISIFILYVVSESNMIIKLRECQRRNKKIIFELFIIGNQQNISRHKILPVILNVCIQQVNFLFL